MPEFSCSEIEKYDDLICGAVGGETTVDETTGAVTTTGGITNPQQAKTHEITLEKYALGPVDPVEACKAACKRQEKTRNEICRVLSERVKKHFKEKLGCEVSITPKHSMAARRARKSKPRSKRSSARSFARKKCTRCSKK